MQCAARQFPPDRIDFGQITRSLIKGIILMRFAIIVGSLLAFVGCNPAADRISSNSLPQSNTEMPVVGDFNSVPTAESKTVAVTVTGMMCPHGCYPEVKSLISKKNDIESIELTPQREKDVIDNPVILVKYRGELNKEETTKAILGAGFEKVEYADQ